MGTTKLTRKEILAEDPVHGSMVMLVDFFRTNTKNIFLVAAAVIILIVGVYWGRTFWRNRGIEAQEILAKGIDYYHARVDPEAAEALPAAYGPNAVFKSDELKYKAVIEVLEPAVSGFGYSKVAPMARYYLGLAKLKAGMAEDGIMELERVAGSSADRAMSHLAKNVLAHVYAEEGKIEEAKKTIQAALDDTGYELPKEELRIQLARILTDEGKYEEALSVLQAGASESSSLSPLRQRLMEAQQKAQKEVELEKRP